MSYKKRLETLEQHTIPATDIPFPARPQHSLESAISIILQLVELGALPEYPPASWTDGNIDSAMRIDELMSIAKTRKESGHEPYS